MGDEGEERPEVGSRRPKNDVPSFCAVPDQLLVSEQTSLVTEKQQTVFHVQGLINTATLTSTSRLKMILTCQKKRKALQKDR